MRKVSLYVLSFVLFTPNVLVAAGTNSNIIYYDTSGECQYRWCDTNPGYACCSAEHAVSTLPVSAPEGMVFAGYSPTPSNQAEGVANLAATGMGDSAWFINNYTSGEVPNVLYAKYVTACKVNNASPSQLSIGYNGNSYSNAYCEVAYDSNTGQLILNAAGKPQYNTRCYDGFVYVSGKDTYKPKCKKPTMGETSDYVINAAGCSGTHPENCDETACTKTVVNKSEYNFPWMQQLGFDWCYDENTGQKSCEKTCCPAVEKCCLSNYSYGCKSQAACEGLNKSGQLLYVWDECAWREVVDDESVCVQMCKKVTDSDFSYVVHYKCAEGEDNLQIVNEVDPSEPSYIPYSINAAATSRSQAKVCYDRIKGTESYLWNFLGWKIEGTNTIVQPGQSVEYTQTNQASITLVAQWESLACSEDNLTYCDRQQCEGMGYSYCADRADVEQDWGADYDSNAHGECIGTSAAPVGKCCSNDPRYCTYKQCTVWGSKWNMYWAVGTEPRSDTEYCAVGPNPYTAIVSDINTVNTYGSFAWPRYTNPYTGPWGSIGIFKKQGESVGYADRWSGFFDLSPETNKFRQSAVLSREEVDRVYVTHIPGYENIGHYDQENCMGNKIINGDGTFVANSVLIPNNGTSVKTYPCLREIDTEEPAEGLLKVYIGANIGNQFFGDFTKFKDGTTIPSDDPKLHREDPENVWYGPVYFRGSLSNGSDAKFYVDNNGTIELPHGLPMFDSKDEYWQAHSRLLTRNYTHYNAGYDFYGDHSWYPMKTFGTNNNRSALYGTLQDYTNNDLYRIGINCGTGEFAGYYKKPYGLENVENCETDPYEQRNPVVYGSWHALADETGIQDKCDCYKPGYHLTGWKVEGTNTVIPAWQPFRWIWRKNMTFVAQWEPD